MKRTLLLAILALVAAMQVRADENYTARSGRVEFVVGSNVPFVKVSGASTALRGGGEVTVADDVALVRSLHFEIEPTSFKTGIQLRDQHLYEKVFRAADGSMPKIVLRGEVFRAKLNPQTSRWEGDFQAQLTLRGITRPVLFHATGAKVGDGASVNASGTVSTADFGVPQISNAGVTVKDQVKVTVTDLLLRR